jgi:DNA adenine methylase|tara:strand:- start:865 stop:1593 length:729 start_codon:yes stop_codon:yes gene_type:complete
MQYLGGKSRIAKQIIDIMSAEREEGMTWVEPFMGSGKVISQVSGRRIGADINHEMIALFKAIRGGWKPPTEVTREFYNEVVSNQDKYTDHLKAFINIGCSFGALRWGSYANPDPRPGRQSRAKCTHDALIKLKPRISSIELFSCDYKSLHIPPRSLIYCDPPYANTAGYGFKFNHIEFYDWCRERVNEGHYVFVSEYNMPSDFEEVWSREVNVTLNPNNNSLNKVERLYRLHKKPPFSLKMY